MSSQLQAFEVHLHFRRLLFAERISAPLTLASQEGAQLQVVDFLDRALARTTEDGR